MKSKKLNLNELKVKSFVTNLEKENDNTIKGGYILPSLGYSACCTIARECETEPAHCC